MPPIVQERLMGPRMHRLQNQKTDPVYGNYVFVPILNAAIKRLKLDWVLSQPKR